MSSVGWCTGIIRGLTHWRSRFQGCRIRDIVAEYEHAIVRQRAVAVMREKKLMCAVQHDIAACEEAGQIVTVAGVAFSANLL